MKPYFQVGERVRVTLRNTLTGHRPGDQGTVLELLPAFADRSPTYYLVEMDQGDGPIVVAADEIESDAAHPVVRRGRLQAAEK